MRNYLQANSSRVATRKRGRVLRVPGDAPGLLMVEGQQFRFSLDGLWRSSTLPQAGLIVDVDMDRSHQLVSVTVASGAASTAKTKRSWLQTLVQQASSVGVAKLAGLGVLVAGWWFLTNVSVELPLVGRLNFTFWQLLGVLNNRSTLQAVDPLSGQYDTGFYGMLAIASVCGPVLHQVWRKKQTFIAEFVPLAFMFFVSIAVRTTLPSALGAAPVFHYFNLPTEVPVVRHGFWLGPGAYLSLLATLYFAGLAVSQLLTSRPSRTDSQADSAHAS